MGFLEGKGESFMRRAEVWKLVRMATRRAAMGKTLDMVDIVAEKVVALKIVDDNEQQQTKYQVPRLASGKGEEPARSWTKVCDWLSGHLMWVAFF